MSRTGIESAPEEHDVPGLAPFDDGGDVQLPVVGVGALADHHLQQEVPGEELALALRREERRGMDKKIL